MRLARLLSVAGPVIALLLCPSGGLRAAAPPEAAGAGAGRFAIVMPTTTAMTTTTTATTAAMTCVRWRSLRAASARSCAARAAVSARLLFATGSVLRLSAAVPALVLRAVVDTANSSEVPLTSVGRFGGVPGSHRSHPDHRAAQHACRPTPDGIRQPRRWRAIS